MGDIAHAHISEFSGNGIGVQFVTHWQSWRRNAVNFRNKMRVICKVKRAILLCLGALTPAPYALYRQLIANRSALSV